MRALRVIVVLVVGVWAMGLGVSAQDTQIAEGERIVEIWTCSVNEG